MKIEIKANYIVSNMSEPVILRLQAPRHRKRMAMFDFDWTLVKPKSGNTFPKNVDDWEWWQPSVPECIRSYYEKGFQIVVVTNQSKPWKQEQIVNAMTSLQIPCTIVIAFDKTIYKPSTVMFDRILGSKDCDRVKSFFVGDALGRRGDFADSDKKFAEAIGVRVMPPEDVFPMAALAPSPTLRSNPLRSGASLASQPSGAPLATSTQEIVVLVGYPGAGKSTLTRNSFPNYTHIESDAFNASMAPMIRAAKQALQKQKSVLFDGTHPTVEKRAHYIKLAKDFDLPIRCVHVATSMEDAMKYNQTREHPIPNIAYYTYRKRFVEPTTTEGFSEVITIF